MRETERRIKKYQARLPRVREKIFASLALFGLAASMLAVATFSWITLSIAPQAEGITTTVAANGNLEIALANSSGTEPGTTEVGDGALSRLFQRNTTWGNLINLNDAAYGLEKITLRPAVLNILGNLLEEPFAAADYESDGRANKDTTDDFRFTVYDSEKDIFTALTTEEGQGKSNYSAVKAVSYGESTLISFDDPLMNEYDKMRADIGAMLLSAGEEFHTIALGDDLKSVTGLLSSYLSYRQNNDNDVQNYDEPCTLSDVQAFYRIMMEFYEGPMTTCGEAYMKMFEMYQLKNYGELDDNKAIIRNYTPYTDINTFCKEAPEELKAMGYDIAKDFSSLRTFIDDWQAMTKWLAPTDSTTIVGKVEGASSPTYNAVEGGATVLYNRAVSGQTVMWCQIKPYVHGMLHIDGTTGATIKGNKIATLGASEALGLVGSGEKIAEIHGGIIYNMDARVRSSKSGTTSQCIRVTNLSVKFIVTVSNVTVQTSASDKYPKATQSEDLTKIFTTVGAKKQASTFKALDTYGYAIDFWVRTNAKDSYLLLDGKLETEMQPVVFQLGAEEYDIYFASIQTVVTQMDQTGKETVVSDTTEDNHQVYQKNGVWYHVVDNAPAEGTIEQKNEDGVVVGRETRTIKTTTLYEEPVVVGFSGSNRIWNQGADQESISRYSTSQGSGSCYTFYAADPNELAQSLEILSALRVAFIDQDAEIMAIASLDVEHYYPDPSGKVTVPLVLNSDALDTGKKDESGDAIRAITYLEQNQATFICALVYLDGASITNDKALESKSIQGQFNIQFASTEELNAMVDDELKLETREVDAKLNSAQTEIVFEGVVGEDRTVTVTVTMEGATASSVSASFSRQINANQGTRQELLTFTSADGGRTWTATTTFDNAGVYLLREIIVDGDSCMLETPCSVTVKGFTVNTIMMLNGENYAYRTANSSVSEDITVTMSAGPNGDLPESVKAVFVGDNGITVITELTGNTSADTWSGTIRFGSSGTYKMTNLILENEVVDGQTGTQYIDSQYYEIGATYTRTVYLGLRVSISILPMPNDIYEPDEYLDGRTSVSVASGIEFFFAKPHSFDVSLVVTDESGEAVPGLNNVSLFYSGGLDTNLTWSPLQKRYIGSLAETADAPVAEFLVNSSGVYKFDRVMVGNEEIKIASYAPIISAYSRASMKLAGVYLAEEKYVVALSDAQNGGCATQQISLEFEEAATASVYGLFEKTGVGATEYYIIPAVRGTTVGSENTYIFTVPRVNGYWELKEIKMSGINYDDNPNDDVSGTFYTGTAFDELFAETDENGSAKTMVEVELATWNEAADYLNLGEAYPKWNVPSDSLVEGVWTQVKVIASVTTQTLEYPNDTPSGGYVTLSNLFMEEIGLPAMKVTILDFEGKPIENVNSVAITLVYDHNSAGYTSSDLNANKSYTVTLNDNGDGTYTAAAGSTNIKFDGLYQVAFNYKIGNVAADTVSKGIVGIKVQTTMPTVVISGVNPNPDTNMETHDSSHKTTDKNSFNFTSATVYFTCKETTNCGSTSYEYGKSTVTITLSNIGAGEKVTLNFVSKEVGDVYLFNDSTKTSSYEWTVNGTCTRSVGSGGGSSKSAAKLIEASTLVVKYNNAEYSITVPTISINNPY